MSGAAPTTAQPSRLQLLHTAVVAGDLAQVELLAHGACVNHCGFTDGLPLLALAAGHRHVAVAETLLRRGASPHLRDRLGFDVLQRVAWAGDHTMAEVLLAGGANPTALSNGTHRSALTLAAMKGDAAMVSLLLAAGAAVETRDAGGMTPLDHATLRGFDAAVEVLLQHGADGHAARFYCEQGVRSVTTVPQRQSFDRIVKLLCAPWAPQSAVSVR